MNASRNISRDDKLVVLAHIINEQQEEVVEASETDGELSKAKP